MEANHMTSSVFDKHVARNYETWYGQEFGRFASRQEEALLHQQLQRFPGASSLLEVGCGTGHFTRWFETQGLHVTGLDASPAMLEQARLRNGMNYLLGVLNRQSLVETLRLLRGQHQALVLAQAHRFSAKTLTCCVQQAAGTQPVRITWRTTIFPGPLPLGATRLPWGEYLGMSVHFGPGERSQA